jgi:hypothetical protein
MSDSTDLTKLYVDLPHHWWLKGESMWGKPLGGDLYEIQNIPFCAYGLNCGDVVRALAQVPDQKPQVIEVVRRGPNQTVRISFCNKLSEAQQQPAIAHLEAMGAWLERCNAQFLGVNLPPTVSQEAVCAYLSEQEALGVLEFETCEPRVPGSFDYADGADEAET